MTRFSGGPRRGVPRRHGSRTGRLTVWGANATTTEKDPTVLTVPRKTIGAATVGAVALALVATSVAPAHADDHLNLPGEPTLTLPINDSEAGGTYDQDFTRAYAGTTPDGTPVYIYVPAGTPLDGSTPTGVASLDPAFDHNPDDEFVPCATADAADFRLSQAQIDYLGDTLAN